MKIIKTIMSCGVFAGIALAGVTAQAASVSLIPSVGTVQAGDTFSIDLYMDALDAPGNHPGQFSGLVSLQFDSQYIDFTGFDFAAPAIELVAVGTLPAGTDDIVSLGFENALDVGVIGTYNFVVNDVPDPVPAPGTNISFSVYDSDDFFGSFANEAETNQSFTPDFQGTTVSVVPLPAAMVLLLSAFATLIPGRRRKSMA